MKKKRPTCASPGQRRYRLGHGPRLSVEKASDLHAKAGDAWTNRLVEWKWSRLYAAGEHCLYAVIEHGHPREVVALFALHPTARKVGTLSATRLDYFEVQPTRRGGPLPGAVLGFVARFSDDLRRDALVLDALPAAAGFYEKHGGSALPGWSPPGTPPSRPNGRIALGYVGATLQTLQEVADALEDQNDA